MQLKETMSATQIVACFLLWISLSTQEKTPDVTVTCLVSEECRLPCSFKPGSEETIEWFRQDVVVYKFKRDDDDDDDSDDDSSSKEHFEHKQLTERVSVSPHLVSSGNAILTIRRSSLKDRGTYRCHVHTSNGEHNARVILKVEAPIRGLSLELSRLSGYEEMKCTIQNVFPAPQVTWATEPPTLLDMRPVTRVLTDNQGLFNVDSRLRLLKEQPDLIYICKVMTSYGGPAWTTSLREREIKGSEGRDVTIPCYAPPYLNNPSLEWSFSNGKDLSHILTYDSGSGRSSSAPSWDQHVELDSYSVPFGDGSLRLMDPKHAAHTGSYTCVFSVPYNNHTERIDVTINVDAHTSEPSTFKKPSYWWVAVLVIGLLVLGLVALLLYLKKKGNTKRKPTSEPEEVAELNEVRDSSAK
uniref:Ig-like domain-containing protein n=1 Tax=Monopterus albus TaxID=43700 RepID=A0A3Q3JZ51_MONAL